MKNFMINLQSIFRSFRFAFSGLYYVIKSQNNARFHLLATILVITSSFILKLNTLEWCFILLAIGIVWIAECFNTSLEKLFDLVNPDQNILVKYGKDSGAAAVLIAAILSSILGIIVLVPHMIQKIHLLFG